MGQILLVTFPFFALVLLGWAVTRLRLLPLESIPGLNAFVLYFALPCMLYRFAATTPIVRLLDVGVSVTYLLCAIAMVGITIATTRRGAVGWNDASFGTLVAAFPNSGFMGVPLLVALLGAAWSIALGCVSAATGVQLPDPAMRAVSMMAEAASPVALFTLGAVLARSQLKAASVARAAVSRGTRTCPGWCCTSWSCTRSWSLPSASS